MAATRIHHLNFVVRDLDAACERFRVLLELQEFERIDHAPRGAHIARAKLGESWLVLVCPYDPDSVPGRHLAEHGEGFFLLSVGSDDFDGHLAELADRGALAAPAEVRSGILDWRIADLPSACGALLQLTDDG